MSNSSVLKRLRDELWDIPKKAKNLPWALQSPWSFKTHMWMDDDGVLIVDLHDLSVPLARQVVTKTLKSIDVTSLSAVCLITGQGKNSSNGPKILPATIEIARNQSDKRGWDVHMQPGRVYVVLDPSHAPKSVTNELSKLMMWGIYAFFTVLFGIVLLKLFTA
jgi:hypothetical protein